MSGDRDRLAALRQALINADLVIAPTSRHSRSAERQRRDLLTALDRLIGFPGERVAALEAALWAVRAKHALCDGSDSEFDLLYDVRQLPLAALEPAPADTLPEAEG